MTEETIKYIIELSKAPYNNALDEDIKKALIDSRVIKVKTEHRSKAMTKFYEALDKIFPAEFIANKLENGHKEQVYVDGSLIDFVEYIEKNRLKNAFLDAVNNGNLPIAKLTSKATLLKEARELAKKYSGFGTYLKKVEGSKHEFNDAHGRYYSPVELLESRGCGVKNAIIEIIDTGLWPELTKEEAFKDLENKLLNINIEKYSQDTTSNKKLEAYSTLKNKLAQSVLREKWTEASGTGKYNGATIFNPVTGEITQVYLVPHRFYEAARSWQGDALKNREKEQEFLTNDLLELKIEEEKESLKSAEDIPYIPVVFSDKKEDLFESLVNASKVLPEKYQEAAQQLLEAQYLKNMLNSEYAKQFALRYDMLRAQLASPEHVKLFNEHQKNIGALDQKLHKLRAKGASHEKLEKAQRAYENELECFEDFRQELVEPDIYAITFTPQTYKKSEGKKIFEKDYGKNYKLHLISGNKVAETGLPDDFGYALSKLGAYQ